MESNPDLKSLHGDPRFTAMVADVKNARPQTQDQVY